MAIRFQYIYKDPEYDRLQNPERRLVKELAPIGMVWKYKGIDQKYTFEERGKATSLRTVELIVIVESGGLLSRSLIIDYEGNEFLIIDKGRDAEDFFDVYYVEEEINILSNHNNTDYVTVFDEKTMSVRYKKERQRY